MVNIENMQKWIDALRSGEYTKIKHRLETLDGNCAEGVACREAIKDGVEMRVTALGLGETAFDGETGGIPLVVRDWLGLNERPMIGEYSVVSMNDHTDQTFADIADGLYQQYLKEPE